MVDLALLDRVAQGADDVLLADHLVEGAGAVAAVEGGRLVHRGARASVSTARRRLRGGPVSGACDPKVGRPCRRCTVGCAGAIEGLATG